MALPPVDEVVVSDRPLMAGVALRGPRQQNPDNPGGLLWMREWKLSVGPKQVVSSSVAPYDKGPLNALNLSELDFSFSAEMAQNATAAIAKITIHNPPDAFLSRIQYELTQVWLEAGYAPPSVQYGLVFAGQINYFEHGKANETDTYVIITAMGADQSLNAAIINTTLPEGHTQRDVLKAVADAMGTPLGQVTDLGPQQAPRGRALYGMARDVLRDLARTANANPFIDNDGKLNLLRANEPLHVNNDIVPVLNSQTGLIGVPTQTLGGGVNLTCLLNPNIRPGSQVKVAEKDVRRFEEVDVGLLPGTKFALENTRAAFKSDGIYSVYSLRHRGETRGNTWYTEIVTVPIDPTRMPIVVPSSA